jgi:hypothetical protein
MSATSSSSYGGSLVGNATNLLVPIGLLAAREGIKYLKDGNGKSGSKKGGGGAKSSSAKKKKATTTTKNKKTKTTKK